MTSRTSRLLVVVGAAGVGTLVGAQVMFAVQDPGAGLGRGRPTSTMAPADDDQVEVEPVTPLAPAPDVVLTWTPTALDPTLEPAARAASEVRSVSVVRGAIANLVASRDDEGQTVQQLDPGWMVPLDAIAVDPSSHAEFASLVDRATVARLADGEALLSRTSASLRGVAPGGALELVGGRQLTVAGIVDDTTLGAAELAVTSATGATIGVDVARYMLVAYEGDRTAVETALRQALPAETPVRFRGPGETPFLRQGDAVLPPLRLKELFGEFAYQPPPAGAREFVQDPTWQAEHLVERDMPVIGPMRCHREVVDAVQGALAEIEATNLAGLVDAAQFAGCWNPRLVRPGGDLSHHAWGVAFDLNYDSNPTCQESVQDPRLVDVLERWGFTWGGGWLCPDPAHFEWAGSGP